MLTYLKAQVSLTIGSLVDFLITYILVEFFHCWYLAGNLAGNIFGATTQFLISRNWVFRAGQKKIAFQITKFILVYLGNLFLSAGIVYLLTHFLSIHYMISKLASSIFLGLTYNYILQKKIVFAVRTS